MGKPRNLLCARTVPSGSLRIVVFVVDVGVPVPAFEGGDDVGDAVQVGAVVAALEHDVLGEHLVRPVPVVVVDDVPVVGEQRLDGEDVLCAQYVPIITPIGAVAD